MNFVAVVWSVCITRLWKRPPLDTSEQKGYFCVGESHRFVGVKQSTKLCDCKSTDVGIHSNVSDANSGPQQPCSWHFMLDLIDRIFFLVFLVYLGLTILILLIVIPLQRQNAEQMFETLKLEYDVVYKI